MSHNEFVIVYVAVPLVVALGWLLWRARYFLRNLVLYSLAVAALLAVIRLGNVVWTVWERVAAPRQTEQSAPVCLDARPWPSGPAGSCWT
jgi:hypothetical protein